jgi:hypothetical protein
MKLEINIKIKDGIKQKYKKKKKINLNNQIYGKETKNFTERSN